jgi:hypothetical protein
MPNSEYSKGVHKFSDINTLYIGGIKNPNTNKFLYPETNKKAQLLLKATIVPLPTPTKS